MSDHVLPAMLRAVERGCDELRTRYSEQHWIDDTHWRLNAMAHGYYLCYRAQLDGEREIRCEVELHTSMDGHIAADLAQRWGLGGKIDKLVRAIAQDALWWIVDHKTTGLSIDKYLDGLVNDNQARQYALLCLLSGYDIEGITWDVSRKPALRKKRGESESEFEQRLIDDLCDRPDEYFARVSNPVTMDDLQIYLGQIEEALRLLEVRRAINTWERCNTACDDYGRRCAYHDLCFAGGDPGDRSEWQPRESHGELDDVPNALETITYSRHKCLMQCPRKHFYRYELAIEPAREEAQVALSFGTIWHDVMDVFWTGGDDETSGE